MFAAVGGAAALFGFVVVLGDGPFAVALVAAPCNGHRFGFDGVFGTHRAGGVTESAAVGQP